MSKTEFAATKVPASVWVAGPVPLDGAVDDVSEVAEKIRNGRAFLKVVAYPWGVEFDVCESE